MLVTAWVLLVFFAILGGLFFRKLVFLRARLNLPEITLLIFSIFIVAVTAGIVFGGWRPF